MKPDPIRILVVDDEPLILNAVRMMLSYEGHLVEAVSDARKALAIFEPEKFDLIITDYMMPGMKGDALAIAIKSQAPQQPVMLLTAHIHSKRLPGFPLTRCFARSDPEA